MRFAAAANSPAGSPGDVGDLRPDPRDIGDFIQHLVGDHGRFHVGDEQVLLAAGRRLDDDVERGSVESELEFGAYRGLGLVGIETVEEDVGSVLRGEPLGAAKLGAEPGQRASRRLGPGLDLGSRFGGDQRQGVAVHRGPYRPAGPERQAGRRHARKRA